MPSSRRPKAKARKSRDMNMMYYFDNIDVMIGNENINSIEMELANTIEGSTNHSDTKSNFHPRRNSARDNELRAFDHESAIPRRDRFLETMETFTSEINVFKKWNP